MHTTACMNPECQGQCIDRERERDNARFWERQRRAKGAK